jgi:hypothetical protein
LLQRHDFDFRIDGVQRLSAGFSLGHADASLRVQDLALQVGEIDGVVIDQRDLADAGRCQVECCRRTEAAGTDDQGMGIQDACLTSMPKASSRIWRL